MYTSWHEWESNNMWSLFLLVYFLSSSFRQVAAAAKGTVNWDKTLPRKQVLGVGSFSCEYKKCCIVSVKKKTCLISAVFLYIKKTKHRVAFQGRFLSQKTAPLVSPLARLETFRAAAVANTYNNIKSGPLSGGSPPLNLNYAIGKTLGALGRN